MTGDPKDGEPPATTWDAYWRLTPEAAALRAGGPLDAALARFWRKTIGELGARGRVWRMLDFACGGGAVTQLAQDATESDEFPPFHCGLDGAWSAVAAFRERFPAAGTVVSDARATPFADRSFGLVASQFGLEYAGIETVGEAARLVAPGGTLALVLHMKDGDLYRECGKNHAAMVGVRSSGILAAANEVFRRGAAVSRGQGSRAAFRRADEGFAAAVRAVDAILAESGEAIAGGTVYRLYADLAHLYGRMGAHDPDEIARWTGKLSREIEAYVGRMTAMLDAAVDEAALDRGAGLAASLGLTISLREALFAQPRGESPAAWLLVGQRAP